MPDPKPIPSFPLLLQRFFVEHLGSQRAVSPRTIAAYRDTFRLLLSFAEAKIGKAPTRLALADLDAQLILSFLDHLEKVRSNGARSRNARLAALRSFLKYAAHHDLTALPVIEQALAIPMKRFERPVLGFLSRDEMQAILDAPDARTWAGQRDRALFSLMYNTGARVSEVIGLRVGDVLVDGSAVAHLHGKGSQRAQRPALANDGQLDPQLEAPVGRPRRGPFPVPEPGRRAHGPLKRHPAPGACGVGRRPSVTPGSRAARYRLTPSATPRRCISCSLASTSQ